MTAYYWTPLAPNSISFSQIRNVFYGISTIYGDWGTNDSNLYDLNYYRGKYYTSYYGGGPFFFPSGQIAFSNIRATGGPK